MIGLIDELLGAMNEGISREQWLIVSNEIFTWIGVSVVGGISLHTPQHSLTPMD